MYSRILVATGGSPWSNAALRYAIALGAHTGAELRILTVLTEPQTSGAVDRPESAGPLRASIEAAGHELLSQAAAHATRARVVHTTRATWGNIAAAILHTAAEDACDLIVMGARQDPGGLRHTLGSIVNPVAAQAPQPILVVKQSTPLAAPFGRRLLVAAGGSTWSMAAVEHAVGLVQHLRLELRIVHVERDVPRSGEASSASTGAQILTRATEQATAHGITAAGTLASGDVVEAILSTASTQQCSTIVLGSRGVRGWPRPRLGALVNAVACRTPLPVLIVKHFVSV